MSVCSNKVHRRLQLQGCLTDCKPHRSGSQWLYVSHPIPQAYSCSSNGSIQHRQLPWHHVIWQRQHHMRSLWAFPGIRKLGWHCWPALKYGMHDSRLCADLSKDSIRVKHNHIHLHTIGPVSVYAPELKAEVLPQELSNRRQCIRLLPPLHDHYAGLAGPETETARTVHCFNLVFAVCHHAAIAIIHAPVICSASHVPGHHHHEKASTSSHACGPETRRETRPPHCPNNCPPHTPHQDITW